MLIVKQISAKFNIDYRGPVLTRPEFGRGRFCMVLLRLLFRQSTVVCLLIGSGRY